MCNNFRVCCVGDGVWTDWAPWSQCTERCANTGTRERSRECAGQVGIYGADCSGFSYDEELCMEEDCQQPREFSYIYIYKTIIPIKYTGQ